MASSVEGSDAAKPIKPVKDLPSEERARAERLQGFLRSRFRKRQSEYSELREALNQANMPVTYYDYLAKTYIYSAVVGVVSILFAVIVSAFLIASGSLSSPFLPSPEFLDFFDPLVPVLPYLRALVFVVIVGGVTAGLTRYALLKRPYAVASARRRNIDTTLPHAIFFMYTLSYGGTDIESVFRKLADSEDQYGEVAVEFQGIVNDIEYFGTDIIAAMRHARARTPSSGLNTFFDDMLTIIDSGGNITTFLDRESENYIQRANEEQESFLGTLALVSEAYLALLIAGPIFVLIGLLVVAILGGEVVTGILLTVYVFIPLLSAMMIIFVDMISSPYELSNWRLPTDEDENPVPDDERAVKYAKRKRNRRWWKTLRNPLSLLERKPVLSLILTAPAAVAVLAAVVLFELAEPSLDAVVNVPVSTAFWLILLPAAVVAVPYTALYERRMSKEAQIRGRLPSVLSMLSNANEIGMNLVESIDLVAKQSGGRLVDEIKRARNDIRWNADVEGALSRSANRVRVPSFTRVFNLIKEANKSSGDMYRVLTVAARDATTQRNFRRRRYQEISTYVTVVVLGFFIYLFILVILDEFYVQRVIEAGEAAAGEAGIDEPDTPLSLNLIPTELLRMAYFHSAIIQAVCAGLISGKILKNDMRAGLKYAIGMSAVALVVFALLIY